jgi:hypothetical protein
LKEIDQRYEKLRTDPANARRENMDAMSDRRDQEYMKVLNQSQYDQWEAYIKRMDARQSSARPLQPTPKADPEKKDIQP